MVTLTQNLYLMDEVKLAFLTALLKKQDLNECHYWLNEMHLSLEEREVRNYLEQIYYDFYYAMDTYYFVYSESVKALVERLFHLNASPLVFLLGQLKTERPKIISIKKKDSSSELSKYVYPFIQAVSKNQYQTISSYANKLLVSKQATRDELVKALYSYYKNEHDKILHVGINDDFRYVMAVYARFHLSCQNTFETVESINKKTEYTIPLSISSFKLQRWSLIAAMDREEETLFKKLTNDPLLIAFGLSLHSVNSVTDILFATVKYIKTYLNPEDLDNFIDGGDSSMMLGDAGLGENIIIEQKMKQRLWLEDLMKEYSPRVVKIKDIMMLPTFAAGWLKEVFPNIVDMADLLLLVEYKMLELF